MEFSIVMAAVGQQLWQFSSEHFSFQTQNLARRRFLQQAPVGAHVLARQPLTQYEVGHKILGQRPFNTPQRLSEFTKRGNRQWDFLRRLTLRIRQSFPQLQFLLRDSRRFSFQNCVHFLRDHRDLCFLKIIGKQEFTKTIMCVTHESHGEVKFSGEIGLNFGRRIWMASQGHQCFVD